ncbi:unnamed protein product [Paramecium primaurelia]|uniref:Uncharacterized protein n=1 Tax=Paramecium primaurelia TaxID=5886 RepID=A0A8S1NQG9_PARPR|nr:unnamed protein product [Paramecium primaurelia]
MSDLLNKITSPLRGGGFGSIKIIPNTDEVQKPYIQEIENFITRFDSFVQTIQTKAAENIYKLIKNSSKVLKSYNLILDGILKLLKSCLFYIRTDSFKLLFILTSASLSKVIFSFHIRKDQRFMNCDTQKHICEELRQQMEIEKNDLIHTQLELYLFLTKTSFQMAPNDSKESDDILQGCLNGIINSIIDVKPNTELLIQLFHGACLLYNTGQYELYFQINMLQLEILNNQKNDNELNLEQIILQIEKTHEKFKELEISFFLDLNDWKNPNIYFSQNKKKIKAHQLLNLKEKWKEYLKKGFLIKMNHSNDQAIILLNEFNNNELTQVDILILVDTFKEWENLILLKDFLMNEEYKTKKMKQLETFNNFLFDYFDQITGFSSGKLQEIGSHKDKLQNFIRQYTYYKITKEQAKYNSQLKNMIFDFIKYFQNTQKIIKIIRLNLMKQYFQLEQLEQKKINEFKVFHQLKYIMRLLEINIIINKFRFQGLEK